VTAERYPVATVVCVRDRHKVEPWWCLAAGDPGVSAGTLIMLLGQRMLTAVLGSA
jgi:hypothetical protein